MCTYSIISLESKPKHASYWRWYDNLETVHAPPVHWPQLLTETLLILSCDNIFKPLHQFLEQEIRERDDWQQHQPHITPEQDQDDCPENIVKVTIILWT